jgi:glutamyl-tRNA reductase
MHVVVLGCSHQTASVEVREKLSFAERQVLPALGRLLELTSVLEGLIVSTCNRTEIYALVTDAEEARAVLSAFWAAEKKVAPALLKEYGYFYVHEDAMRHLLRVTAGVDSLIVGESQILAQVKGALAAGLQCDSAGKFLSTLFQAAIKMGKQVRTETNIGRGSVSVSSAAVEVATKKLGDLHDKIVLIYGAGKMSTHTIKALFQRGAQHVYIVNRTLERAQETASRLGGEAIDMDAGRMLHAVADVIIVCTSAPTYLIRPDNYPVVPGKERLLIDISVPRNVDPALDGMRGIHVVDLDGLEAVARSNREERANQIIDAEVLIEQNLREYVSRLASFQLVPTIQADGQHLDAVAADETADFLDRHASLIQRDPRAALERFSRALTGRLMHQPMARLKGLDPDEQTAHAEALANLFGLEVEDANEQYLRKRLPERARVRMMTGELR